MAQLALHIVERALMAIGELNRPDGTFRRLSYEQFIEEYAGMRAHRRQGEDHSAPARHPRGAGGAFRKSGQKGILKEIVQFTETRAPGSRGSLTPAHKAYHRGQLALYARPMATGAGAIQRIEGD